MIRKGKNRYHHGNLAESLLDAVDEIASDFGLESVTLRACARLVGVSPSSAFRHYTDKRSLMTAFATRALVQLSDTMSRAAAAAGDGEEDAFLAVGLAYIGFALEKPAFFRAMWREETIYTNDEHYIRAAARLAAHLQGGFARSIEDEDPSDFSPRELLAWSAVHGLADLFVDGPVGCDLSTNDKVKMAREMLLAAGPALSRSAPAP